MGTIAQEQRVSTGDALASGRLRTSRKRPDDLRWDGLRPPPAFLATRDRCLVGSKAESCWARPPSQGGQGCPILGLLPSKYLIRFHSERLRRCPVTDGVTKLRVSKRPTWPEL